MTSEDIKYIRAKLGRTRAGMAKIFGVSGSTIYRWERGTRPLPEFERKLKKLLDYVQQKERGEV